MEEEIIENIDLEGKSKKILKDTEFVGRHNLSDELARLKKESFDNLNYTEKIQRYNSILSDLDTVIRTELDRKAERERIIRERMNSPELKEVAASNDIVWQMLVARGETIEMDNVILSYKDWQIEFLVEIINKLKALLDNVKGASEERIIVKTMREGYEKLFEQVRKEREEYIRALKEADERKWAHQKEMMDTLIKAIQIKAGIAKQPLFFEPKTPKPKQEPKKEPKQENKIPTIEEAIIEILKTTPLDIKTLIDEVEKKTNKSRIEINDTVNKLVDSEKIVYDSEIKKFKIYKI